MHFQIGVKILEKLRQAMKSKYAADAADRSLHNRAGEEAATHGLGFHKQYNFLKKKCRDRQISVNSRSALSAE